jgi:hypothetical protein
MSNIDSPALFDPALFWGVILVILFCLHGFYAKKRARRARQNTTPFTPSLNPNTLRGFASSRELKTLPSIPCCPSVISREGAKPRRRGFEKGAKLQRTLPLPEECVGLFKGCGKPYSVFAGFVSPFSETASTSSYTTGSSAIALSFASSAVFISVIS